jgi:hypothetical protein
LEKPAAEARDTERLMIGLAAGARLLRFLVSFFSVTVIYAIRRSDILKSWLAGSVRLLFLTNWLLLTPAAQAQTPTPQPSQGQSPQTSKERSDIKKQEETGTSNDRLFYTLPNFLTVETKNVPPLTAGQKFKVVTRGSFDFVQIPWYTFLAGVSQAENSEPGFGQGAAGYGKRLASYAADGTIENYFTGAVLPSVLHQDPRYFQLGQGGFVHRTGYAISRIFITRSDSGHTQFNFSEIVGSAMAASISTYSYHPREDRTLSNTASVWGTQVGYDTMTLGIKEFWPDIRRKLQKRKHPPQSSSELR